MYPSEFRYTREHEWIRIDDDICVLGITEFAQKELGEVVYVELPETGHVFDAGAEPGGHQAVVRAGVEQRVPDRRRVPGSEEELETVFAGVPGA